MVTPAYPGVMVTTTQGLGEVRFTRNAYVSSSLPLRRCRCNSTKSPRRSRPAPRCSLKIKAAGVCHSDLHIWDGYYEMGGGKRLQLLERGIKLPLTMGHENVGEVVAVGPDAKGVKIGDIRLANPWIGCGECMVCKRGEENSVPDAAESRRLQRRRLCQPSGGAASAPFVRYRHADAGAGGAAGLFGRHRLQRA